MREIARRLLNIAIAADQMLWTLVTLGNGSPDETVSAAAWRMEQQGKLAGRTLRRLIDALFWFDREHCRKAYNAEFKKLQLPGSYRAEQ